MSNQDTIKVLENLKSDLIKNHKKEVLFMRLFIIFIVISILSLIPLITLIVLFFTNQMTNLFSPIIALLVLFLLFVQSSLVFLALSKLVYGLKVNNTKKLVNIIDLEAKKRSL